MKPRTLSNKEMFKTFFFWRKLQNFIEALQMNYMEGFIIFTDNKSQ